MPLPETLTLMRHGESEGNVAIRASRSGDDKYFTDEYRSRHSATLRLTDNGKDEARKAGVWIANSKFTFTRFYTSSHLRAVETAAHLGIVKAKWQIDLRLREHDFGDWDMNSYSNRLEDPRFLERGLRRLVEGPYWRPPNGDSIADDAARETSSILTDWSDLPGGTSLLAVTHDGKMKSFHLLLNRDGLHVLPGVKSDIGPFRTNCHMVQYSRRNLVTGFLSPIYVRYRSIPFPYEKNLDPPWTYLNSCYLSNEELLNYVEKFPRIITGGGDK